MAKAKSGGTRSYLRGKIANDVYSIGKDGTGKRQQVVRSMAEYVTNPQTTAQMRGRMIMATVMQGVSALKPVIDHSFDGVMTGQPSISEFIRRNYAAIKDDVALHPDTANSFGLNKYQEKGAKAGKWIVSDGSVAWPSGKKPNWLTMGSVTLMSFSGDMTVQGFLDYFGLTVDGYLTYVAIDNSGQGHFSRISVKDNADLTTVITSDNLSDVFDFEVESVGEFILSIEGSDLKKLQWDATIDLIAQGVIMTQKQNSFYKHTPCVMACGDNPQFTANAALVTYPFGSERYLNGGELIEG